MFDVVLYRPEIPPNTGNVIRLCANTGARLHLVEPLGFSMDDRQLRRAGLHKSWEACVAALGERRIFALSRHAKRRYDEVMFRDDDAFVFGPETRGLPAEILAAFPHQRQLCLPMRSGNRSLNLSNAVAVVVFEAWRQRGFPGRGE